VLGQRIRLREVVVGIQIPVSHKRKLEWGQLYYSALSARNCLKKARTVVSPSNGVKDKDVFELIPVELFNPLAWICDVSGEFEQGHVSRSFI